MKREYCVLYEGAVMLPYDENDASIPQLVHDAIAILDAASVEVYGASAYHAAGITGVGSKNVYKDPVNKTYYFVHPHQSEE